MMDPTHSEPPVSQGPEARTPVPPEEDGSAQNRTDEVLGEQLGRYLDLLRQGTGAEVPTVGAASELEHLRPVVEHLHSLAWYLQLPDPERPARLQRDTPTWNVPQTADHRHPAQGGDARREQGAAEDPKAQASGNDLAEPRRSQWPDRQRAVNVEDGPMREGAAQARTRIGKYQIVRELGGGGQA